METNVVALCGGVGGARLLDGLAQLLPPERLTAVVNTGDDFEHWGLWISPDVDTCMYTLAGLAPIERGWGLTDESFHCFETLAKLGGESWFQLGDRDLAVHLRRTQQMAAGRTLTEVTQSICMALGVHHRLLPMTDAPCQTFIETHDLGTLSFQQWLVRHRGQPRVKAVHFQGATQASNAALAAINEADVVIIAPSNPYVSVDPMFSLEGFKEAVAQKPIVAVSPIVAGKAVKGPLATMIPDLTGGLPSAHACQTHYADALELGDHSAGLSFVVQHGDSAVGTTLHTDIIMGARADRARLAAEVLTFAGVQH